MCPGVVFPASRFRETRQKMWGLPPSEDGRRPVLQRRQLQLADHLHGQKKVLLVAQQRDEAEFQVESALRRRLSHRLRRPGRRCALRRERLGAGRRSRDAGLILGLGRSCPPQAVLARPPRCRWLADLWPVPQAEHRSGPDDWRWRSSREPVDRLLGPPHRSGRDPAAHTGRRNAGAIH